MQISRQWLMASSGILLGFLGGFPGLTHCAIPTAQAAPVVIDRLEASVNSSIILLSDVEHFRKMIPLRKQLDPIFAESPIATEGAKASKKEIVDFLIDEKLISQAFPVTDAQVEQQINAIQENNHIDRNQLKAALAEQGYTFDEYFELIRSSASKRNLIDSDIRTKVTITDDDVKNYFYNHYSNTNSGDRSYDLRLIYISPATYKTKAAARDAARSALKAVQAGEPFEEVAKRMSDDATAPTGGNLGVLREDQMSPMIRDALKNLQIGQVSHIVGDSAKGYYILKLVDVKSDESGQFAKVKDEIRSQLVASEYQHQIQLWLERQRQTAFVRHAGDPTVVSTTPTSAE